MWHLHLTILQNPPSILKDGRKHHSIEHHHYSHSHSHQLRLLHPLTVVQRQSSIAYHCNLNHNTEKAKPLYEARAPPQATQNIRAYKLNYNSYNKRKKQLLYKYKSSRISRQSTQGCSSAPLVMCKIQPTPPQHIRHSYLLTLAVN